MLGISFRTQVLTLVATICVSSTLAFPVYGKALCADINTDKFTYLQTQTLLSFYEFVQFSAFSSGPLASDNVAQLTITEYEKLIEKSRFSPTPLLNTCLMSKAEITAILLYSDGGFSILNSTLRNNPTLDSWMKQFPSSSTISQRSRLENMYASLFAFREVLNSALDHIKPFYGRVYRGVNLDADKLARYSVGAVVTEPAFLSTSKDLEIAKQYANESVGVIFIIDTSIAGREIEDLALAKFESEVLFKSGSLFKVTKIATDESGHKLIYLVDVSPSLL